MKIISAIILLVLPSFLSAQDLISHYKVYDTKKQKVITIADIVNDLSKADVLFFGEEHNDSVAHYLEATILKKMASTYLNKVALTLEMFHTDVQPIIDEYLNGNISEKNFVKESRAWNNYKDYKAMVEFAKSQRINVIGGNAAARYSNAVTTKGLAVLGQFPPGSQQYFPTKIDTATGRYLEKFIETLGGHNMGGMKVYQTQNFWDATMAWSIAKYLKNNEDKKIFQVNGRFHSDEQLGTVAQLKKLMPKLAILNISAFSAEDFNNPNWKKYSVLGNYVILTDPKLKKTF